MNANLMLRTESIECFLEFPLAAGKFVLGRASECDWVVSHGSISRRHAEISVTDMEVSIRDLDSRNGTFVEGQRVRTATITPGQRVRFGGICFRLTQYDVEALETDAKEATPRYRLPRAPVADLAIVDRGLLSVSQCRVLELLVEGDSEKAIAARLGNSTDTVHNHVRAIYQRLGVHSRAELGALVLRNSSRRGRK
jgi:DNA-binding CsgD family transcriptional regulator